MKAFIDKGLRQKDKKVAPSHVWKGLEEHARESGGPASLLAWPFTAAAEKIIGKEKVRKAMWKQVGRRAMAADVAAGRLGQKIPLLGKTLFTERIKVPWGDKKGMYKEIERASALVPVTKAKDFVAPIVLGVAAEKGVREYKKHKKSKQQIINSQGLDKMKKTAQRSDKLDSKILMEKAASVMVNLYHENAGHKNRAHAVRLLFKQAEQGREELPRSFNEFEEKIASLMDQDLLVLERAMELIGGNEKLGELGSKADPTADLTPSKKFQADIVGYNEDVFNF